MTRPVDGTRYTVMGLGILGGGVGVARYLATHGGIVTVTDMRPKRDLTASMDLLGGLPITYHLGGHQDADFTRRNADVVVRNPGVRRSSPYLQMARADGLDIEMEMSLFFRACRAPILGVTGTKGKTSVSTLIGGMLRAWKQETVLAGNMGISALGVVDDIVPDQPVVLELSSWQLEALDEHRMGPHVGVITNVMPDHLDSYNGFDDYAATKRTIAHHQTPDDVIVYNAMDVECRKVIRETRARLMPFGLQESGGDGAWRANGQLVLRSNGSEQLFPLPAQLQLQGDHGHLNALAAIAAAAAYGVPVDAIAAGLRAFSGVENRMEEVGEARGIRFVNDSAASAPAAAVAGLGVLSRSANRVRLIAGGADKGTELDPFADAIAAAGASVTLLEGSATPNLMTLLDERSVPYRGPFDSMNAAFASAVDMAEDGDVVALVPGCASFGLFRNEFDRGEQFRQEVSRFVTVPSASESAS